MSVFHHSRLMPLATASAAAVFGFSSQPAAQSEEVRFKVVAPVQVRLAGTSTLHSWDCTGDRLDLSTRIELAHQEFHKAVDVAWADALTLPIEFSDKDGINGSPLMVKVPIESLECNRTRMQRDLRETVKYEQHPVIEYELEAIRESAVSDEDRETVTMAVTGKLTVAGVSRSVEHRVVITRLGRDMFQVRGELDLKMSWFDMEPPTAFLGMLRAHNDFQVEFRFRARTRGL